MASSFFPTPMFTPSRFPFFSALVAGAGLVLLLYTVSVEGEPGALPLLLVGAGLAGVVLARRRRR